jgi:hypothetical protein
VGCIKNLVAVASSNLNVALEDSAIRQMTLRAPPGGGQGSRHQGGPGRTRRPQGGSSHDCLARGVHVLFVQKAALRSEAAMAAMMTAHVSCGRVSQAFLAILEPKRQGEADSGMSQVTRGQGHETKGWIFDGRNR